MALRCWFYPALLAAIGAQRRPDRTADEDQRDQAGPHAQAQAHNR